MGELFEELSFNPSKKEKLSDIGENAASCEPLKMGELFIMSELLPPLHPHDSLMYDI